MLPLQAKPPYRVCVIAAPSSFLSNVQTPIASPSSLSAATRTPTGISRTPRPLACTLRPLVILSAARDPSSLPFSYLFSLLSPFPSLHLTSSPSSLFLLLSLPFPLSPLHPPFTPRRVPFRSVHLPPRPLRSLFAFYCQGALARPPVHTFFL